LILCETAIGKHGFARGAYKGIGAAARGARAASAAAACAAGSIGRTFLKFRNTFEAFSVETRVGTELFHLRL